MLVEEIVDQGLDDDRVLRRPLDHGQGDAKIAVAIDVRSRRHQDMVRRSIMQTVDLDRPSRLRVSAENPLERARRFIFLP